MTPEDQTVALRWMESRLRAWGCGACGGRWITTADKTAIFHRCPVRRRDPTDWALARMLGGRAADERLAETSTMTDALADAVGEDALLRPVDEED